jgi:hypothetical protein
VRWSITYACPKAVGKDAGKDTSKMTPVPGSASGAVPAQPAAAAAPKAVPASPAAENAEKPVPGAKKAEPVLDAPVTLSGLMCDSKGLKDSKGKVVKKFQMINGKISLDD